MHIMDIKILNGTPLLKTVDNFLSSEICQKIIEYAEPILVDSKIIGQDGSAIIQQEIRQSKITSLQKDDLEIIQKELFEKVSLFTGFDSERFEKITIHRYQEGEGFKLHQDYFIDYDDIESQEKHVERCKFGGNRVSTIIIYLNDVEAGGETWFPWINKGVPPKQGKLLQFNYDYSEWLPNIQTQHLALPVKSGEKWILTVWVRERPLSVESDVFKRFIDEINVYNNLKDVDYEIEIGPDWDRRTLNINLPANDSPENALIIGFTGGMDSSLLLFLIGVLNTHLLIPYQIVPVLMQNSEFNFHEDTKKACEMLDWIQSIIGNKIRNLQIIDSSKKTVLASMSDALLNAKDNLPNYPGYKPKIIFTGVNELPNDGDEMWENLTFKRTQSPYDFWKTPFFNLQKYHLLDLLMQLELEPILTLLGKCSNRHNNLSESCNSFACNERRWAFRKLGYLNIGDKYLTYRS